MRLRKAGEQQAVLKVLRRQLYGVDSFAWCDPPFYHLDFTGYEPLPQILFGQLLPTNDLLNLLERRGQTGIQLPGVTGGWTSGISVGLGALNHGVHPWLGSPWLVETLRVSPGQLF